MKKFLRNNAAVLAFSLILVVIFIVGGIFSRYMTTEKNEFISEFRAAEELRVYYESLIEVAGKGEKVEVFTVEQLAKEYLLPSSETETYQPVAYAIDIETKTLIDIKVISHNETQSFYSALDEDFFLQLNDKTLDDVVFKIDTVAGSTYSSKAFETGMKYARELFARDFSFEIPNIVYTINSIERNYDPATFVAKPFIANITYGAENMVLEAYFDSQYNLVEIISGDMPSDTYLNLFKNDFPTTSFVDLRTHITAYDSSTRVITIRTNGYGGMPITVAFELNETLDGVVGMQITTTQTYDEEYNDGYTGAPAPAVENAYKDAYLADGTYIDAVSSATITSNAMIRILTLMDNVLEAWNGGGN